MNNPIVNGWYADPEARYYEGKYYIYATRSTDITDMDQQMNIDAFSSTDLKHWEKHEGIIQMEDFPWIYQAVWAPTIHFKNGKYYLIFASNEVRQDDSGGGLEIAVSDSPAGPFRGMLKHALVGKIINGAQPIDAHLFEDDNGTVYLYFGGWGHCNVAVMNERMDGFLPFEDGTVFREITPQGYVEGPCMLKRKDRYYFMWSQGDWMDDSYCVAYGIAEHPAEQVKPVGKILFSQPDVASGPGHHGYLQIPGTDEWHIVYHRHPVGSTRGGERVLSIDRMLFQDDKIMPVIMT